MGAGQLGIYTIHGGTYDEEKIQHPCNSSKKAGMTLTVGMLHFSENP